MLHVLRRTLPVLCLATAAACSAANASYTATSIPAPAVDAPLEKTKGLQQIAVVAGGCFWGIQAVFQHTKGVQTAVSGYAGGSAETADYESVSSGRTGHAESVRVRFDPSQITFGQLLHVFFSVAHDPTEVNRQGPDSGTQYRSAIFFLDPAQQRIAEAYVKQLNDAGVFGAPIATKIVPLEGFYPAEAYHQDYARLHPNELYIRLNDAPKVDALRKTFPDWFVR